MLKINKQLTFFSLLAALYTIIFYSFLEWCIQNERWYLIWVDMVVYIILMILAGKLLGEKDDRLKHDNTSFTYHLATFLIVNVFGFIWISIFRPDNILYQTISCLSWMVGLLVHYIENSRSLKGYDKKEVFK